MNKKQWKKIIDIYFFIILIIIFFIVGLTSLEIKNENIELITLISFIINIMFSLYQLVKDKFEYSLNGVLYIFVFVFFGIAASIQYIYGEFPQPLNNTHIENDYIFKVNIIIFVFMFFYATFYKINFLTIRNKTYKKEKKYIKNFNKVGKVSLLLILIGGIYVIKSVGFYNLFNRGDFFANVDITPIFNVVDKMVKTLSIFLLIIEIKKFLIDKKVINKLNLYLILLLNIIFNFPLAVPRFWLGSVMIGIFLSIKKRIQNKKLFYIIFFGGLFIIFPFLSQFRIADNEINLNINLLEGFKGGDYDSYKMFYYTVLYVEENGLVWGNQLLGALLFFIPRSIWIQKPTGSGPFIANNFEWNFTNVSNPYMAEGYLNFGIFGVIIFAFILAKILSKMDFYYWLKESDNNKIYYLDISYVFLIGLTFFMYRGDFLNTIAFMSGFLIPIFFIYVIDYFRRK